MDLDFYIFLATAKIQKNVKYIFYMKPLKSRQRDTQTDKKQIFTEPPNYMQFQ